MGESGQRHLPRPAAIAVGVVVELVHHHVGRVEVFTFAQRQVGEHLCRAADHRAIRVDAGIAGQHADVFGPEV